MNCLNCDPPLKIEIKPVGPMVAIGYSRPVETLIVEPAAAVEIAIKLLETAAWSVVKQIGEE